MHQLHLSLQLQPEADFATFVAGPNGEAVATITDWANGIGSDFLYLFGIPGCGKTHLLQAACRQATQNDRSAVYLPLDHGELTPSVLDDLELWDLVALDDVQAIAGDATWEHGLFDLYNRLRESTRHLVVSANAPVAELPLTLADLRSRLGWGPGYRLLPLSDGDCERLFRESAQRRGLDLGNDVVSYIMRRCPRDASYLMALLEDIDQASLRAKRRPTLWLVKQVLAARET